MKILKDLKILRIMVTITTVVVLMWAKIYQHKFFSGNFVKIQSEVWLRESHTLKMVKMLSVNSCHGNNFSGKVTKHQLKLS